MNSRAWNSFFDGWNVFYQARTVFAVLLIIAMLINVGIFVTVRFVPSLVPAPAARGFFPGLVLPRPATGPADSQPAGIRDFSISLAPMDACCPPFAMKGERWPTIFGGLMAMTGVITVVSIIFLLACALLGLLMLVAGQLPGAGLTASAFFYAVALGILALPWCNLLPQLSCLPIGVIEFDEMRNSLVAMNLSGSWADQAAVWIRFVVYPLVMVLGAVMYFGRTSQANALVHSVQPADIPIK